MPSPGLRMGKTETVYGPYPLPLPVGQVGARIWAGCHTYMARPQGSGWGLPASSLRSLGCLRPRLGPWRFPEANLKAKPGG